MRLRCLFLLNVPAQSVYTHRLLRRNSHPDKSVRWTVRWRNSAARTGKRSNQSDPGTYATSVSTVASHLVQMLQSVYSRGLWPRRNGLFVTGESYAGHYAPMLCVHLLQQSRSDAAIDLRGVAIGNAFVDAPTQVLSEPGEP